MLGAENDVVAEITESLKETSPKDEDDEEKANKVIPEEEDVKKEKIEAEEVAVIDESDTIVEDDVANNEELKAIPIVEEGQITPETAHEKKTVAIEEEPADLSGKECLEDEAQIKNSEKEDWKIEKEKGIAETKDVVELGVKYIFPLDEKISVTFSCLPKDPEKREVLRIEKISASEIDLPEGILVAGDFAYDVTTEMENGDFEYEITLPKTENVDAQVSYIEKSAKEVTNEEIEADDLKEIKKDKINQEKEIVKISELDHFTVFLTIVEWNFPNNPDNAVADGGILANLSKEIVGVGVRNVTFDNSGYRTMAGRAIGWDNGVDTKYWQIEFDTRGYEKIALSSKQRSSQLGPKDFKLQFRTSIDKPWTDISGGEITVGNEWVSGVVESIQLPEEASDTSLVFVRWVVASTVSAGESVVGSVGSSFIDNIVLKGIALENTAPVADAKSFTITEGSSYSGAVSGTDVDGDPVTFQNVSGPMYGSLTFNADGSFVYGSYRQPTVGFSGTDTITFKANDGNLFSEPATINITINSINDAPDAYTDSFTVEAGQSYNGFVGGFDVDGDSLTFELWADPLHGSIPFINSNGSFTYTANSDYSGADSFAFRAKDGLVYSSPAIVSITVNGAVDETAPNFDFIDLTPSDGDWINYNNPEIKIEADEELSGAYLDVSLGNGGFENGLTGYDAISPFLAWQHNDTHHDGHYSAMASGYSYYNDTSSHLERTVNMGEDGTLSFWMKADTEENKDFLIFTVNGEEKARISGNVDWTKTSIPLLAGTNKLRWTYEKDTTGHVGADSVWIDDVEISYGFENEGLAMIIDSSDKKVASYQLSDLLDIENQYQVTVYDLAGNKTTSEQRSFKVDTVAPTGYVNISPYQHNREVSGVVNFSVSLTEGGSYLKDVCLWLGDEEDNLLPNDYDNCKNLNEHSIYSYDSSPDFGFDAWDTAEVEDGEYNLYAIATDNAGNVERVKLNGGFIINNYSEGSSVNPSEISTCAQFQAIKNNLNWHYKIVNNIDCTETKNWNSGKGFSGIGDGGHSFIGVVDGQNYIISNLYQSDTVENSGIFNYTSGRIANLNFRDVDIVCHSTYCGAFTVFNWGTIERSSITGTLQCSGQCGGFSSQESGTISECWGDMIIGNSGYPSGFAGQFYGGTISNSYFKGQITADNGGGIVGLSQGTITNTYSNAKMNNSGFNGGLIGWQHTGDQIGSYWNKEVSGLENMCGTNGTNCLDESGLTDAEMKNAENFVGWDFENIWAIDPDKNDGYPYLQWQTSFTEKDKTAPIITLLGESIVEIEVGANYTDAGATAIDNVDGNITNQIVVDNPIDISVIGEYEITYNVSDKVGNNAQEVKRVVRVVEKEEENLIEEEDNPIEEEPIEIPTVQEEDELLEEEGSIEEQEKEEDLGSPNSVSDLKAKYKEEKQCVKLSWELNDDNADKTKIYRGQRETFSTNSGTRIGEQDANDETFNDCDVEIGQKYYYKVIVFGKNDKQSESKKVSIKINEDLSYETTSEREENVIVETIENQEDQNTPDIGDGGEDGNNLNDELNVLGEQDQTGSQRGLSVFLRDWWYWILLVIAAFGAGWYVWKKRS